MKNNYLYKIAIEGIVLTAAVLLIFSCLSFDISDAPSRFAWPHNQPATNLCGTIGAFFAYYLLYFIGPGVFIFLIAVVWAMITSLSGVKITQPVLRLIGLCLVVCAASCSWYLLWPEKLIWPYTGGGFPMGNGGVLGIASGLMLTGNFAVLGTTIIVCCCWFVGLVLLADSVVLAILRWIGRGVNRALKVLLPAWADTKSKSSSSLGIIWKRLSEKQQDSRLSTAKMEQRPDLDIESTIYGDEEYEEHEGYEYEEEEHAEDQEPDEEQESAVDENEVEEPVKKRKKKRRIKLRASSGKKAAPYVPKTYDDYELPPLELLDEPEYGFAAIQEKMVESKARILEELLGEFGVNAHVVNAEPGPAITMYELELAPGVKVNQISNLANDMARALSAGSVRVVAPLMGRHTIGIEVPNSQREIVRIKELIQRAGTRAAKMHIPLFLGKSSSGEVLISDLASMPHLLIAGTTGSGKSVCINSIIASILMTRRPDEVKMILIDPKMVEMAIFESLPHLMCPTVTETRRAEQILEWATTKMDERYELLAEAKVRNLASYNKLSWEEIKERFNPSTPEEEAKIPKMMPHIIIVIDELADLMMTSAKEVEAYIVRIAQKSRAVGIHLIVATQRPQATVVTGLIKSNMPARIGFRVAARMDSRIILDQNGAETLLGQGDMLFLKPGTSELVRSQGAYMDDDEIHKIVDHLKEVAQPQFHPELMQLNRVDLSGAQKDDLYEEAIKVVLETKRGSVSLLQRRLSIGYARASRIIEMMAATGLLGEYKGSQAREVTMTLDEYEEAKRQMLEDEVAGYADLTEDQEPEEYEEDDEEEDYDEAAVYEDEDEQEDDVDEDDEYEYEDDEEYRDQEA